MIVRPRPRSWQLLYIMRGSIVPAIAPKVAVIFALGLGISLLAERIALPVIDRLGVGPFTLLGLALSIYLSFRNNACHERWWEGRKLWGQLVHESRSLARECNALLADDPDLRRRVLRLAAGFAHALAARLRDGDIRAAAAPWIDPALAPAVQARNNVPDALLGLIAGELAVPLRDGRLSPYLYTVLEARLAAMASIQAGCERILTTPLPFAYTLLLHRFAWLFCLLLPFGLVGVLGWATPFVSALLAYAFFGLDRLGDELEDPFGLEPNDLPLDALARIIAIDLMDAAGERPLPEPLQPQGYVLR